MSKFKWTAIFAALGLLLSLALLYLLPVAIAAPAWIVAFVLEKIVPGWGTSAGSNAMMELGIISWVSAGALMGALVDWDAACEKQRKQL